MSGAIVFVLLSTLDDDLAILIALRPPAGFDGLAHGSFAALC
jgi:hypothetical protein